MAGKLATRTPGSLFSLSRHPLATLRDELEDLVSRSWGGDGDWFASDLSPSADISETDKTVDVRMDLPGMKPADLDIKLSQNVLTVSGERKEEKEEKGRTFHRIERRLGKFSRSFTLPCAVVDDEVAAEYRDGTLTITLPKSDEAKARKISVKS